MSSARSPHALTAENSSVPIGSKLICLADNQGKEGRCVPGVPVKITVPLSSSGNRSDCLWFLMVTSRSG